MTAARQPGLPWQVLSAWGDLRASYRRLMATRPTEGKLLAIAMLSGLVAFLQWAMLFRFSGEGVGLSDPELLSRTGAQFISAILYRTLMLYLLAAVFALVLGRFGGTGGWVRTRAAVFWAALIAAPVMFVLAGLGAVFAGTLPPVALEGLAQLSRLLLVYVLAVLLAEAHGFTRVWPVFAGIVVVSIAMIALTGALLHMD
ncbi:MAG: hypothetical protein AAGD47_01785 [Pseudomonadota bacterium]